VKPGDAVIPRNLGLEPHQILANLTASQPLSHGLSLGVSCQNLFNTTNLLGSIGVLTSPRFGQARRAMDGRSVSVTLSAGF
jgi:hypothetical protein